MFVLSLFSRAFSYFIAFWVQMKLTCGKLHVFSLIVDIVNCLWLWRKLEKLAGCTSKFLFEQR